MTHPDTASGLDGRTESMARVLAEVLTDDLGVVDDIAEDSTLEDLGLDSLSVVELTDMLNERLGLGITDEELAKTTTVGAAVRILSTRPAA